MAGRRRRTIWSAPLNRRGVDRSRSDGRRLLELELVPELLLVSPAAAPCRQPRSWRASCRCPRGACCARKAYIWRAPRTSSAIVRATGPRVTHLLVVTHNPGLSELVQLAAAETAASAPRHGGGLLDRAFESRDWRRSARCRTASGACGASPAAAQAVRPVFELAADLSTPGTLTASPPCEVSL